MSRRDGTDDVNTLTQHISDECGCTPRSVNAELNNVSGYLDVEVSFEEADLAAVTDLTQTWSQSWETAIGIAYYIHPTGVRLQTS